MNEHTLQITTLKANIAELEQTIKDFEIDQDNYVEQYEELLDECHGDFMGMSASRILKVMDATAYRCGLNDYIDGIDIEDDERYKELQDELEELEDELEELEEELEELESEL